MNLRPFIALAVLVFALAPKEGLAGGFAVSEAGSKASGRGGAVAALHDDPSSVFFNPANVSRAEGLQLGIGASGLMPRWKYTPVDGDADSSELTDSGMVNPPNFSATWQLGDAGFGEIGAGVGVYVPYGSTFAWPEGWSGREHLQQISLTVFEVSPVLAIRPHKTFAIGAGFRYLPSSVYLKQAVRFGDQQEGSVELAGSGAGMGASAGVSFWPTDGLALAITWRSPVTLKMTGASNFDFPAPFDTSANDRDVKTEVPLAEVFRFGVAYDALPDRLSLSADVEYQMWSTFKAMSITFLEADGTENVSSSRRDAQNSFVLHLGGEYKVTEQIALRAGYIFDQRILPESTVNPGPPESDRHIATVGASYSTERFGLHAHFANAFFAPRTSLSNEFPGQWEGGWPGRTMAYAFGLTASVNLGLAAPLGSTTSTLH